MIYQRDQIIEIAIVKVVFVKLSGFSNHRGGRDKISKNLVIIFAEWTLNSRYSYILTVL